MPTGIPYADEVINAVVGCTHSGMPGCDFCWAKDLHTMRHKAYLAGKHVPTQYAKPFGEIQLLPERIYQVLSWRKPRTIFWCSTADMFHNDVPFEFIDEMFAVMASTPHHTHLILTKRVKRMAEYCANERMKNWPDGTSSGRPYQWPLPNVWLGISCSTQKDLDEMAPVLFQIPAMKRWISLEPLLGPVEIPPFEWVVIGSESGKNRRLCNIEWVRSIVRQCKEAHVALYVKQLDLGGKIVTDPKDFPKDLRIRQYPDHLDTGGKA